MARSSNERTEANRRRIVEAADRLFREHGFDAVGIADVMKAAGMTQGGFYRHFANKEALAAETLAHGFDAAASHWRSRDADPRPTPALVERYLSVGSSDHRCPMLAFGEEIARTPADGLLRSAYLDGARLLHDAFVASGSDGACGAGDDLLFAAMVGAGLLLRVGGDREWVRRMAATVTSEAAERAGDPGNGSE